MADTFRGADALDDRATADGHGELTQRRYLEGFFAGLHVRGAGGTPASPIAAATAGEPGSAAFSPDDPWRVLLACAERDRPPTAGERAGLTALGVMDLAPEGRDGCRVRLRAPGGRLGAWQLRELAAVAQEAAGGFIEIGERGGPELAVVGWRESAGALARLRAAGLAGGSDGVRCSPAAGLDAEEICDVMTLARTLEASLLPGGGPRIGLDGMARGWTAAPEDDLTLRGITDTGGEAWFKLTAGGMRFGLPAARAASAVILLGEVFRRNGSGWQGLNAGDVRAALELALDGSLPEAPQVVLPPTDRSLSPGIFVQRQPGLRSLVAAGPADGRWRSRALGALAGLTETMGAGEARVWPGGVLVPMVAEVLAAEGMDRLAEIVSLVR